ncbi:hypothetical protein C5167_039375, partial [Papaver somniferum]
MGMFSEESWCSEHKNKKWRMLQMVVFAGTDGFILEFDWQKDEIEFVMKLMTSLKQRRTAGRQWQRLWLELGCSLCCCFCHVELELKVQDWRQLCIGNMKADGAVATGS